jgi:hypothetical protein
LLCFREKPGRGRNGPLTAQDRLFNMTLFPFILARFIISYRKKDKKMDSRLLTELNEEWLFLVPFVQCLGHRLFMSKTGVRFP